MRKYS